MCLVIGNRVFQRKGLVQSAQSFKCLAGGPQAVSATSNQERKQSPPSDGQLPISVVEMVFHVKDHWHHQFRKVSKMTIMCACRVDFVTAYVAKERFEERMEN